MQAAWTIAFLLCMSLALGECSGPAGNSTTSNVSNSSTTCCTGNRNDSIDVSNKANKPTTDTTTPTPTIDVAPCSVTDTLVAQAPILFFAGLAYLGIVSGCTFAPRKEDPGRDTGDTSPVNLPVQLFPPTDPIPEQIDMQPNQATNMPLNMPAAAAPAGSARPAPAVATLDPIAGQVANQRPCGHVDFARCVMLTLTYHPLCSII